MHLFVRSQIRVSWKSQCERDLPRIEHGQGLRAEKRGIVAHAHVIAKLAPRAIDQQGQHLFGAVRGSAAGTPPSSLTCGRARSRQWLLRC